MALKVYFLTSSLHVSLLLFLFLIPLLALLAGRPSRIVALFSGPSHPTGAGEPVTVAWRVFVSANQHMLF